MDAQGNVYAGDGGDRRIQVFDNNGVFKTAFSNFGNAQAMCITKGASPVLYVSNSNPWNDIDVAGEIYRMGLDGTVRGKFGRAGRLLVREKINHIKAFRIPAVPTPLLISGTVPCTREALPERKRCHAKRRPPCP